MISLLFSYEAREPADFEEAYGAHGDWAAFFRSAPGYIGTELLRDLENPGRYLVIDRWDSADAYNAFIEEHQAEYLRLADEALFYYNQELRFGTFETIPGT